MTTTEQEVSAAKTESNRLLFNRYVRTIRETAAEILNNAHLPPKVLRGMIAGLASIKPEKITPEPEKISNAVRIIDRWKINNGGAGSGCHGENCGRPTNLASTPSERIKRKEDGLAFLRKQDQSVAHMPVPFPVAPRGTIIVDAKKFKIAKPAEVNVDDLIALQYDGLVGREHVGQFVRTPDLAFEDEENEGDPNAALPWVIKKGGKLYIGDGHHRLTSLKITGVKSAPVMLSDLDKEKISNAAEPEEETPEPLVGSQDDPEDNDVLEALIRSFAGALASGFSPVRKRLEQIAAMDNEEEMLSEIAKLRQRFPAILKNLNDLPESVEAMEDGLASGFLNGLTSGAGEEKSSTIKSIAKLAALAAGVEILKDTFSKDDLRGFADELKERANVVAKVTNAEVLNDVAQFLRDIDASVAKERLAKAMGVISPERLAKSGKIRATVAVNAQMASGYGYHRTRTAPAFLEAFPAQELFRAEPRLEWRNWPERWEEAGGVFFDGQSDYPEGRMIAAMGSPIWTLISRWGTPFAPFDYNSGMDLEPISRAECVQLGIIIDQEPEEVGFNDDLTFSPEVDPDLITQLYEDVGDDEWFDGDLNNRFSNGGAVHFSNNCGTGAGGFQPGNTCGKEDGESEEENKLALAGQNINDYEGKAPDFDWDASDNPRSHWNENTVSDFTNSPNDQFVYRSMIDLSDLNPKVAEVEQAKEIRALSEKEFREQYAHEFTGETRFNEETEAEEEVDDWREIRSRVADESEQSWEDTKNENYHFGGFPPIVVTRVGENEYEINDGNHRTSFWQDHTNVSVAPAWVNDKWLREQDADKKTDATMSHADALVKTDKAEMVDHGGFSALRMGGESRKEHGAAVFEMCASSYAKIGMPYKNAQDILDDTNIWDVSRDAEGKPIAYLGSKRTEFGIKVNIIASNGTPEGKTAVIQMLDVLKKPGYYSELSDAPLRLAERKGVPIVPFEKAEQILAGKKIERIDDKTYKRFIGGLTEPHVKVMFGNPIWKPKQKTKLKNSKRNSHDLTSLTNNALKSGRQWLASELPKSSSTSTLSNAGFFHKFGCLLGNMPPELSAELIAFTKNNVPEETVTGDGIEVEPHVTVKYGFLKGFDEEKLAPILLSLGDVKLTLGKIERFENGKEKGYDVLKISVASPDLHALYDLISEQFSTELKPADYDYHPHVTLAYVLPGTNLLLDGSTQFDGKEITLSEMVYSADDFKRALRLSPEKE